MKNESSIEELVRHEGLRLKPYKCSANSWTIGVGRNLDDIGISGSEALVLLKHDIARNKDVRFKPTVRFKPAGLSNCLGYINYGRDLETVGISEAEAMMMLRNDIARVKQELKDRVIFYLSLSEKRQEVLINMCFNLGINRLLKFKRMFAAIDRADYPEAGREMLDSRWARQVGNRSKELAEKMRDG